MSTPSDFDEAKAQVPSCALTEGGLREQRARYARLAPDASRVERESEAVIVEFREGFDRDALDEALAVERDCCPFFSFGFHEDERTLRITVRERGKLPALDAIAHAFGPSPPG